MDISECRAIARSIPVMTGLLLLWLSGLTPAWAAESEPELLTLPEAMHLALDEQPALVARR